MQWPDVIFLFAQQASSYRNLASWTSLLPCTQQIKCVDSSWSNLTFRPAPIAAPNPFPRFSRCDALPHIIETLTLQVADGLTIELTNRYITVWKQSQVSVQRLARGIVRPLLSLEPVASTAQIVGSHPAPVKWQTSCSSSSNLSSSKSSTELYSVGIEVPHGW